MSEDAVWTTASGERIPFRMESTTVSTLEFEMTFRGKWIKGAKWFDCHHPVRFVEWLPATSFVNNSESGCYFVAEHPDGTTSEYKWSTEFEWILA